MLVPNNHGFHRPWNKDTRIPILTSWSWKVMSSFRKPLVKNRTSNPFTYKAIKGEAKNTRANLGGGFEMFRICFMFTPKLGEDEPILTNLYFSMGLVQPPSSNSIQQDHPKMIPAAKGSWCNGLLNSGLLLLGVFQWPLWKTLWKKKIEHRLPIFVFNLKRLASQPTWPSIPLSESMMQWSYILSPPENQGQLTINFPFIRACPDISWKPGGCVVAWGVGLCGPSYSNHLSCLSACQGIEFIESWTKLRRLGLEVKENFIKR